jgi:hypothetical protein
MACLLPLGALSATVQVSAFGASGSAEQLTCRARRGERQLYCPQQGDFRVGQGVLVEQAGLLPHGEALDVLPPPEVRQVGTGRGPHRYCYVVAVADPFQGVQRPSAPRCIDDQPELDADTHHEVFLRQPFHQLVQARRPAMDVARLIPIYLWYGAKDDGPFRLHHVSISHDPRVQYVHTRPPGPALAPGWPDPLPSRVGAVLRRGHLFTRITDITPDDLGVQLKLEDAVGQDLDQAVVQHDDTDAIQQALDQASLTPPARVLFGPGTYLVRRPRFHTGDPAHPYSAQPLKGPPILWWQFGPLLHLNPAQNRHIHLIGQTDGPTRTVIDTGPDMGFAALLHIRPPVLDRYGGPGYLPHSTIPIQPAEAGRFQIQLARPQDAHALQAGDDIWLFSGSYHPLPSGHADHLPCGLTPQGAANGCHFSELNTIAAVNAATGVVNLRHPLTKRYGPHEADAFGLVRLTQIPHDIALRHLDVRGAHPLLSSDSAAFDVLIEDVRTLLPMPGNALGTGYKRGLVVRDSQIRLGAGSQGWSGTNELDQLSDALFEHNEILGWSLPGSEGPSLGSRLFFSEGSTGITWRQNRLHGMQILMDEADDILLEGNVFDNSVAWLGSSTRRPDERTPDRAHASFGTQHRIRVVGNRFEISGAHRAVWTLRLGEFEDALIEDNVLTYDSRFPAQALLSTGSAEVRRNVMALRDTTSANPSLLTLSSRTAAPRFVVSGNRLISPRSNAWVLDAPTDAEVTLCQDQNQFNGTVLVGPALIRPTRLLPCP